MPTPGGETLWPEDALQAARILRRFGRRSETGKLDRSILARFSQILNRLNFPCPDGANEWDWLLIKQAMIEAGRQDHDRRFG